MKQKLIQLTALLLVLTSIMSFVQDSKWFLLKSNQYGYKIEFPVKPTKSNQVVDSEIGKLKLNMYIYDASALQDDDNLVYLVNCTVYPEDMVNSEDKEMLPQFYRNSIDGAVANIKGRLISEKTINLGDYEGREVKVDYQEGVAVVTMRVFLVNNKMYMIQTITKIANDRNSSISRFFDSFELL